MKSELIENRIIIWDIEHSKELFGNGYFGKPIGIPKPKVDEINVPLVLDLIEGCYLQEISKIKIYKKINKIDINKFPFCDIHFFPIVPLPLLCFSEEIKVG